MTHKELFDTGLYGGLGYLVARTIWLLGVNTIKSILGFTK